MPNSPDSERYLDRVILLVLLALFLLSPTAIERWATDDAHWLTPYLIWGGLIVLGYWLQRRREHERGSTG